jgi:hypothetical protein
MAGVKYRQRTKKGIKLVLETAIVVMARDAIVMLIP